MLKEKEDFSKFLQIQTAVLMKKMQIHPEDFEQKQGLGSYLYETYEKELRRLIARFSAADLGKIAACGKGMHDRSGTTLFDIHGGEFQGKFDDGLTLLQNIAIAAITAEMTDIIKDCQKGLKRAA